MKLNRNRTVKLVNKGCLKFNIEDKDGNVYIDGNTDYRIYMRNVIFRRDGNISGVFLGILADDNKNMFKDVCKTVVLDGNDFKLDGEDVRSAKLAVIDNGNKICVAIEN